MTATGDRPGPAAAAAPTAGDAAADPASFDAMAALAAAGFPVGDFTEEQRAVFAELTAEEFTVLSSLKTRLDEVEPDVQAHQSVSGAALF